MTELTISEITIMNEGLCVIGLHAMGNSFRSVRLVPHFRQSWPSSWPHHRGDILLASLKVSEVLGPHVEDAVTIGNPRRTGKVGEEQLLHRLRRAEVAETISELFGCELRLTQSRSGVLWADPDEAKRSICGCAISLVQFFRRDESWRAKLVLEAGEILLNIPVVDRDWRNFLDSAISIVGRENVNQRALPFLNGPIADFLRHGRNAFVRLGLSRRFQGNCCWLMLDSLFPLPKREWLDEFAGRPEVK